jgi:hypothetical protein
VAEEAVVVEVELGVDGEDLAVGVVVGRGVTMSGLISASEQSLAIEELGEGEHDLDGLADLLALEAQA